MTDQTTTPNFQEAPASWNTRYISPDGFTCQITLRCETGGEVLTKAQQAVQWLQEHDCQPYGSSVGNRSNGKAQNATNSPALCPIHQCEMRRWEKNGRGWYSHKVNGEWCKGK